MALVVLLRGVNVGGRRRLRPSRLAKELAEFDVVNVGAAGTFVVRKTVTQTRLRSEILRRLPFDAEIMICRGRDVLGLLSSPYLEGRPASPEVVRFVSVLPGSPRRSPSLPVQFPATGDWFVKILGRDRRFVFGVYRRHMKAVGFLGALDQLFGMPATTRNFNTINAIARVLKKA